MILVRVDHIQRLLYWDMTDEEKDLAQQIEKLKKVEKVKKGMARDKAKRQMKKKK